MTDLNNQVSAAKTVQEMHLRHMLLALQEIGEIIRDLAMVIAQGSHGDGARIGGCAAGLERAAHRVRIGDMQTYIPDLAEQFVAQARELASVRAQNAALRAELTPMAIVPPVGDAPLLQSEQSSVT